MAEHGHLFWRPGASRPAAAAGGGFVDKDRADEAAPVVFNPNERLSLAQQRRRLPIFGNRRQLLYMVETYRTTVVIGHTGCGKTTQIPQYLHEAGWTAGGHVVCCTQPRRVAATTVAQRVAEEMGEPVGGVVGYAVRFDDCSSRESTRIKFVTDGTLLSEMMLDPMLSRYSVVMVDEAHERSVQTDVLLGLLKKLMRRRPDLRLVVASATVDAALFKDYFEMGEHTAGIISLRGSGVHPVALFFSESAVSDYVQHGVETAWRLHLGREDGDVLLFLTGQHEVDAAVGLLADRALAKRPKRALLALPMYAALGHATLMRVFAPAPSGGRKVIVATTIAETSVTVEGVGFVIDCGFTKQRFTNPETGHEALLVVPESRANARQRAGRAGRLRPGACYVLMPEPCYHGLAEHSPPEMQRCSLAAVALQLKALGVDNLLRFDFLSPPPPESLARALELLFALGAVTAQGELSEVTGARMARLPLEPQLGAMLLAAEEEECVDEAAMLAALLSVHTVFTVSRTKELQAAREPFAVYEGDSISLLNVARRYARQLDKHGAARAAAWCRKHKLHARVLDRCLHVRAQLHRQLSRLGVRRSGPRPSRGGTTGTDAIRRAVVRGFFVSAARRVSGGSYQSTHKGAALQLNPNSVLWRAPPEWIVFHETVFTPDKEYVLAATKIERAWLTDLPGARDFYKV
jgi:ATP-dependent RNA helicase DDX35